MHHVDDYHPLVSSYPLPVLSSHLPTVIDSPENLTSYHPHLTRTDASINDGALRGISPIIETPGGEGAPYWEGRQMVGSFDGIPPMVVACHKLYTFFILISVRI